MSNEENPLDPVPTSAPTRDTQGGRASWEEPALSWRERWRTGGRQMMVHLWGPAGSLVFHVVAIGVLVTFATGRNDSEEYAPPFDFVPVPMKPEPLDPPEQPTVIKTVEKIQEFDPKLPESTEESVINENPALSDPGGVSTRTDGAGHGDGEQITDRSLDIDARVLGRLRLSGLTDHRGKRGRGDQLNRYNPNRSGQTETAVLRALRWLKKNQASDGSWEGSSRPAMTSLALLCFLAHDETPQKSPEFGLTVRRGLVYLMGCQKEDGRFAGADAHDYTQPIATYALCEAAGMIPQPELKEAAVRGIAVVVNGQNPSGGFNYNLQPSQRNDSSYMAWCCQALKAARMAGLEKEVPGLEASMKKAVAGFKLNAGPSGGFGYNGAGHGGLSGAGALSLQLLGAGKAPEVVQTLSLLDAWTCRFDKPEGGSPVYYWYYITQAKFQHSKKTFDAWNELFSPELCTRQKIEKGAIEGPDKTMVDVGHWESPAKGEHTGGVVQDTALCCLMLEVYYRYLPSFQKAEPLPEEMATAPRQPADVNVSIR